MIIFDALMPPILRCCFLRADNDDMRHSRHFRRRFQRHAISAPLRRFIFARCRRHAATPLRCFALR